MFDCPDLHDEPGALKPKNLSRPTIDKVLAGKDLSHHVMITAANWDEGGEGHASHDSINMSRDGPPGHHHAFRNDKRPRDPLSIVFRRFIGYFRKGFTVVFGRKVARPFFLAEVPSDNLARLVFEAVWARDGDGPDGDASTRVARGEEAAVGGDGEPAGAGGGEIDRLPGAARARTEEPGGEVRDF